MTALLGHLKTAFLNNTGRKYSENRAVKASFIFNGNGYKERDLTP